MTFKGPFQPKPFCDFVIIPVRSDVKICICLLAKADIYTVLEQLLALLLDEGKQNSYV